MAKVAGNIRASGAMSEVRGDDRADDPAGCVGDVAEQRTAAARLSMSWWAIRRLIVSHGSPIRFRSR